MDRRLVIAAAGIIGAVSAVALTAFSTVAAQPVILLLAFLFGMGALSYYAVAVAHAADRAKPEQATSMMAGILIIWGIGSIIGPLIAGVSMSAIGPGGLFAFSALALAIMAALMFTRMVRTPEVTGEEKEPFNATQATSLAISEIDPRGETTNEQFDLFLAWMSSQETDTE